MPGETHGGVLTPTDQFVPRHIGPSEAERREMLATLGVASIETLTDETVPAGIRLKRPLKLDGPRGEFETLEELRGYARENRVLRSMIGMGYYDTITPSVIARNIFENPGWYTQYTPYQAEISQGRLEALLNFQTMVADLTGLPLANASLLDEATAAAEAMHMAHALCKSERHAFFVAKGVHPQTLAVVKTRARPLGIEVVVGCPRKTDFSDGRFFGVLFQYPNTFGAARDYRDAISKVHASGALSIVATDLLALALLTPPGEFGADIAIGSAQRFGVPLGGGGPHAAFIATRSEYARQLPGRLIGVSKDSHGRPAYRLAIQTREQHIRREKATSNICTAQVLLAVMAGMYATYHGPRGLRRIAERVHAHAAILGEGLRRLGLDVPNDPMFDTITVKLRGESADAALARAVAAGYNLRRLDDSTLGISCDETTTAADVEALWRALVPSADPPFDVAQLCDEADFGFPRELTRTSAYLTHPVFNRYHCEHEMLRYIKRLEARDLSLTTSNIPLGSCTMKLNAVSEMFPVSWPEFSRIHPYAPADQMRGYQRMFNDLENWLAEITGFAAVSLQPNSGAQGEYAGLLSIRGYHESRGDTGRNVCLIPVSAHGTNPASAVMAGFQVVAVKCDAKGNIDLDDLRVKARENAPRLGALMVTYPSTHGVFEEGIREICKIVHEHGGQVYMDGANMNAQVGLTSPGEIGADVCHLNLHKTFCIPHGGGGPGMGPIAVTKHLRPFLPGNPTAAESAAVGPVSAAPFGSASILPISWMYIRMMGGSGLTRATQFAILNANYMARRLGEHYPIVYTGKSGRVAHEFILDCRQFEDSAGVKVEDIAKRLMDFGYHAPTMSWPVAGTLMVEPTESESKYELDRLCDALIAIRGEIRAIEQGKLDRTDNPLKNAPHTAAACTATEWTHPYPREQAAFPAAWTREHKFWPPVGRVDNVWGDRNLFCTCVPLSEAAGK
ncbi:MAG: glycine dehydrogenase (decarboxylating) [Planctomycetota bacterium]